MSLQHCNAWKLWKEQNSRICVLGKLQHFYFHLTLKAINMERSLNKISLILDLGCYKNFKVVQTPKHLQHGPKQSHNAKNRHAPLSMQTPMTQNLPATTLTLLWTLKSDREAISSSSSRVAEEADILACCCAGVSSCPSVCSSDTANGVGLRRK